MRALRHAVEVIAALLAAASSAAYAQSPYPTKPIRFIVPFAPGGGGDIIVRTVAQKLTPRLGVTVVVDNRTGAGGNVGTELAAHAPADGYTLLMANVAPMAINVSVYKPLPYDPVRDFAPISLMASFPNVLVVHPAVPARSIAELVALARGKPGELTYASAGNGSTTHLAAEFFRAQAGLKLIHVPYKGGGPALTDLLAGQVTMYFGSMPASLPHIRSGRLRALGVTSLQRVRAAPDIPTVAESGFPGFEAVTWIGAVAPAGTSPAIVTRLNREIAGVMREADVGERLEAQGAEPMSDTPEAFAEYIRNEIRKWAAVVRDAGIASP
ncbi:MAG: tripartite tricarboxylate transporter substrate binding protein [Rhodospirillaceae bacterium]